MILRCVCSHAGQDALHGDGRRVHNMMKPLDKSSTSQPSYCCTVCKRVRTAKGDQ